MEELDRTGLERVRQDAVDSRRRFRESRVREVGVAREALERFRGIVREPEGGAHGAVGPYLARQAPKAALSAVAGLGNDVHGIVEHQPAVGKQNTPCAGRSVVFGFVFVQGREKLETGAPGPPILGKCGEDALAGSVLIRRQVAALGGIEDAGVVRDVRVMTEDALFGVAVVNLVVFDALQHAIAGCRLGGVRPREVPAHLTAHWIRGRRWHAGFSDRVGANQGENVAPRVIGGFLYNRGACLPMRRVCRLEARTTSRSSCTAVCFRVSTRPLGHDMM